MECLNRCDRLVIFPACQSPLKGHQPIATGDQRVAMLDLMLKDVDRTIIDTFEIDNPAPSYTWRTVQYLRQQFPQADLTLVVGADQLAEFKKWYKWSDILKKVQLLAFNRDNTPIIDRDLLTQVDFIADFHYEISSSQLRQWLKVNPEKCRPYLHPDVLQYILLEGLYQ